MEWVFLQKELPFLLLGLKQIKKLTDDEVKFNLAFAYSAIDEIRSEIMPINDSINLRDLKESVRYFYEKTKTRVTYEYILFKDVNDDLDSARRIAAFVEFLLVK